VKPVIYIAHPVSGDVRANAESTILWTRWLLLRDPLRVYIAPWVAEVMGFVDQPVLDGAFYMGILDDDCEVVARLDGVVGLGGCWSAGMRQERSVALALGKPVLDMTHFRVPADVPAEFSIHGEWFKQNPRADFARRTP
jgi:hypothetical protein